MPKDIQTLHTVTEYTRFYGLPAPAHPLLTLIDLGAANRQALANTGHFVNKPIVPQLYTVFLKRNLKGLLYYGHRPYDFSEGVMGFSTPGQVFFVDESLDTSQVTGWMLVFHPDLLRKHPLGKKIGNYGFFAYAVHEALHLSDMEETVLDRLLDNLRAECERPIDAFSQDVFAGQIDLLLTYADRFYNRQFVTRSAVEHDRDDSSLLSRFETELTGYFAQDAELPLPSVQFFADALNVSPAYLSDMLRILTGQNTQQHIHQALIEKAKRLLLTTSLSINETAFQLGFEYPQYFSRLFKQKTGQTPVAFRSSAHS
ncbi:helix-turn-helix domain-containing protein [Spirosoma pollinicola]|uniref:AraC family transcriptional regulator n=1 Tax=Spirosoma pollinicola TaxID=2057025 RepID=A0A2K8Z157_9BACT|nr:helix-turn-helix transcriptional regulator [Spirosoma pollinicola]AUD03622.1 AraC family transcriptional regulator [Spirosoma pollinicola]